MPGSQSLSSPPDDWVPIEQRWLGLDKRTILPALIALLVMTSLVGILPLIDDSLSYDREVVAGDVMVLGGGLTFVPVVGWALEDGLLTTDTTLAGAESGHQTARLTHGGLTFSVETGDFKGTPDELMDDIESLNQALKEIDNSRYTGARSTVTTNDGLTGVSETFTGVNVEGIIVSFAVDGTGIQIVASGPPGSIEASQAEISAMIESLATTSEGN